MLITFSSPSLAAVGPATTKAGRDCYASADWKAPTQVRFQLLSLKTGKAASTQAHETFIRAIFEQDPRAAIKTARAIYRGQSDYFKQTGAKND